MTDENKSRKYYCPYHSCEFEAPTERQVRSHITLATHGDHDGINGYTLNVDVLRSDGERCSYKNKNKVNLEEITLTDITDDVSLGKQMLLKIAYNNPDKDYTEIQELATEEEVDYSYRDVRDVIQTHIETPPNDESTTPTDSQATDERNNTGETRSGQFDSSDLHPLTASPDIDIGSTNPSTESQSNETSQAQPGVNQETGSTDTQSATAKPNCDDGTQPEPTPSNFPYDTSTLPDYWSDTRQKIIATHEALDDPTPVEVHSELSDSLGYDIGVSVVLNVLNGWGKNAYDELTDTQQRAIDAMVDKNENETLADVANRYNIAEGTIKYVRYTFTHILIEEGGTVPGTS